MIPHWIFVVAAFMAGFAVGWFLDMVLRRPDKYDPDRGCARIEPAVAMRPGVGDVVEWHPGMRPIRTAPDPALVRDPNMLAMQVDVTEFIRWPAPDLGIGAAVDFPPGLGKSLVDTNQFGRKPPQRKE